MVSVKCTRGFRPDPFLDHTLDCSRFDGSLLRFLIDQLERQHISRDLIPENHVLVPGAASSLWAENPM